MRKLSYVFYLVLCFCFISCSNNTEQWIKEAKKPIIVYEGESEYLGMRRYTLIDSEFNTHETGNTELKLPREIK